MPGTPDVDAADPFACCSMTTPDTDPPAEGMTDVLAELQASVDRVRAGRAAHPAGLTVEQALAYVDDTVELRSPAERTLAREVVRMRGDLAAAMRRQSEQDVELLLVTDAARTAADERDQARTALVAVTTRAGAVVTAWNDQDETWYVNMAVAVDKLAEVTA